MLSLRCQPPEPPSSDPTAEKQGSQLCNRQVCFFTGKTLEQKKGAEVGQQADSRKETLNKRWSFCRGWEHLPLGLGKLVDLKLSPL